MSGLVEFAQDLIQFLLQRGYAVGLFDEGVDGFIVETALQFLHGKSAGQYDPAVFLDASQFAKGLLAIHAGHAEVEYGAEDVLAALLEVLQCFHTIGSCDDFIAQAGERAPADVLDWFFIIDEEYESSFCCRGGIAGEGDGAGGGKGGFECWEKHLDCGSLLRNTVNEDSAFVSSDDAEYGGHAEAAPGEFGGEEGVENLVEDFFGHSGTGVGDSQCDIFSCGKEFGKVAGL